jgi:hypothetical protein
MLTLLIAAACTLGQYENDPEIQAAKERRLLREVAPASHETLLDSLRQSHAEQVRKLEFTVDKLQTGIEDAEPVKAAKPKRKVRGKADEPPAPRQPRAYGDAAGFELPLAAADLPRAKARLKELQAELAALKKRNPVAIPDLDVSSTALFGKAGFLVDLSDGTQAKKPVVVTVKQIENPGMARTVVGNRTIRIRMDARRLKVGDTIKLDMPIVVYSASPDGEDKWIDIHLVERH